MLPADLAVEGDPMVERLVIEEGAEEEAADGATFILTTEGWQLIDFVEPDQSWLALPDGSFESPDGSLRSWLPEEPAGDQPLT